MGINFGDESSLVVLETDRSSLVNVCKICMPIHVVFKAKSSCE